MKNDIEATDPSLCSVCEFQRFAFANGMAWDSYAPVHDCKYAKKI
jgi:hypothetical protein